MLNSKRGRDYKQTIKRLFKTNDGLYVLKCLKEDHVDRSVLSSDSNEMAYRLGQKELIQLLIIDLNEDDKLDLVQTEHFDI